MYLEDGRVLREPAVSGAVKESALRTVLVLQVPSSSGRTAQVVRFSSSATTGQ
jgi:hypothetical protein